ncbi:MAG: hypothetical protein IJ678_09195, partial [Kiritimatiellae bacterium]|nr:hypothetical protein [Kiritimatiellia bacterium]
MRQGSAVSSFLSAAAGFAGAASDVLWPRRCEACGRPSSSGPVCQECRAALPLRGEEGCCAVCGKTLLEGEGAAGTAAPVCPRCAKV